MYSHRKFPTPKGVTYAVSPQHHRVLVTYAVSLHMIPGANYCTVI